MRTKKPVQVQDEEKDEDEHLRQGALFTQIIA
jgi:hypothetical protein